MVFKERFWKKDNRITTFILVNHVKLLEVNIHHQVLQYIRVKNKGLGVRLGLGNFP